MEGSEREPLGERIVEIPDNLEQFESRDPRSTFTAYVPVGSLAKGEALVTKGGPGKTVACAPCHGPDLKGLGPFEMLRVLTLEGDKDEPRPELRHPVLVSLQQLPFSDVFLLPQAVEDVLAVGDEPVAA